MSNFQNEARQFLAYGLLRKLDRLEDANIGFTFRADHLYIRGLLQFLEQVANSEFFESNIELARQAQVFEEFISTPVLGVNQDFAALVSASIYWLSGYTANALVISKLLSTRKGEFSVTGQILLSIYERKIDNIPPADELGENIRAYITTGDQSAFDRAVVLSKFREDESLKVNLADEFVVSR